MFRVPFRPLRVGLQDFEVQLKETTGGKFRVYRASIRLL